MLAGASARAQQQIAGFADDRFEPAGAGSQWMSLESLDFDGHLRGTFSAVGDWAWKPIVFYDPSGQQQAALVRQQAVLNVDAAVLLWHRARFDVNVPLPSMAAGTDVQIRAQSYAAPTGGVVGDLRLGGDVRLFGRPHDRVTGAAGAQLFLPTGRTQSFSSDGGVRFWPRFMLAGDWRRFTWAARLGLHLRPSCACDLAPGSEVTLAGAAGWRASDRVLLGAELYGSHAWSSSGAFARAAPPVELLLGAHVAVTPRWRIAAGVSPGLTNGPGTPTVRGLVGAQYDIGSAGAPAPTALAASP
jgi:hypothetical protein